MKKSLIQLNSKRRCVILILIFSTAILFARPLDDTQADERGLYLIDVEKDTDTKRPVQRVIHREFNTSDAFKNLSMNTMVALLIGNNAYETESGYEPLYQCDSDVRLITSLLTTCCNVPADNINAHTDLTAPEFRRIFTRVTAGLKPGQGFLFTYSGHGDKDGALVFTNGSRIMPEELKTMINSFKNDTVMMLDACYSGNNEGPINYRPEYRFKDNCLRIYSSLAHLSAKEIKYTNDYFDAVQGFYEDVLGLKGERAIPGNGYFTLFIGYFFAEYEVHDYRKITFNQMFRYISNKSKEYVEYLALRSKKSTDTTREIYSTELSMRLDQHPKMLPYHRDVDFISNRHLNLMQKKPNVLTLELAAGPLLFLGMVDKSENLTTSKTPVSVSNTLRLSFGPDALYGAYFGVEAGYMFMKRKADESMPQIFPVLGLAGYRRQFIQTNDILGIHANIGIGAAFVYFPGGDVLNNGEAATTLAFQTSAGIIIHPMGNFFISFDVRFCGFAGKNDGEDTTLNTFFYGIQFPIAVSYKF